MALTTLSLWHGLLPFGILGLLPLGVHFERRVWSSFFKPAITICLCLFLGKAFGHCGPSFHFTCFSKFKLFPFLGFISMNMKQFNNFLLLLQVLNLSCFTNNFLQYCVHLKSLSVTPSASGWIAVMF